MKECDLAYQRWQVAKAIRDQQWRTIEQIESLVGFAPLECLQTEQRRAKNFERHGKKWRLRDESLTWLEHIENNPRRKRGPKKKPYNSDEWKRKQKQGRLFG